jgi:hypothetical protein
MSLHKRSFMLLSFNLLLVFVLASCGPAATVIAPVNTVAPGPGLDLASTQAVGTISAQQTLQAAITSTFTPLPQPSATNTPWPTLRPSSTPLPTWTVVPLLGPTATITRDPAQAGCDVVRVVKDVSIPPGYYLAPGQTFTKTWRLQNAGTCTWLAGMYDLVFDSGEQLSGPDSLKLSANVLPGEMIDVSVGLRAPANHGLYRGYWKLRNASGLTFGQGDGLQPFVVDIQVGGVSNLRYDFLGFFCQAEWKGDGKPLPCIGKDGDPDGFVLVQVRPRLEDGSVDDEPALLTNPPAASDGVIMGIFPEFTVRSGDRFKAVVGCEYESTACNVTFELNYQVGDGPIQNYAHWDATYDKKFTVVDVDLSQLAKTTVHFVLTVRSNGPTGGNRAQWLKPRIE